MNAILKEMDICDMDVDENSAGISSDSDEMDTV